MSGINKSENEEHISLSSSSEAKEFLGQFEWYLENLNGSMALLRSAAFPAENLTPERIRTEVVKHWSGILSQLPLQQQQDRFFQNTLTAALENFILSHLHERVFLELCAKYEEEDFHIWDHCISFTRLNLSADKLGIPAGFATSFPAAVVELAALDFQTCPLDKLNNLRTTLDYLQADIKCAMAELQESTSGEVLIPKVSTDDMVKMLAAVIIQAKPTHFSSNLHYIVSYQHTLAPHDPLSLNLTTFKQALSHLLSIEVDQSEETQASPIGRGMSKEIKLEDLPQLTNSVNKLNHCDQVEQVTPLDYQLKRIVSLIQQATSEKS